MSEQKKDLAVALWRALDVAEDAVEAFGEAQQAMMVEEAAELIVAIRHHARGKATIDEVRTEIADVLICAMQMAHAFGLDEVRAELERKTDRLDDRIQAGWNHEQP